MEHYIILANYTYTWRPICAYIIDSCFIIGGKKKFLIHKLYVILQLFINIQGSV